MNADDIIVKFLAPENLMYLNVQIGYNIKKIARKWSVLTNLDNMIENIPNLRELNDMFIEYCADLLKSDRTWEESLLEKQKGYWPNQKPNTDPLHFHPLYVIDQSLPGNPAYSARQYDAYESQTTEQNSNLYKVHPQRLPLTYKQLKSPHLRGELSAYDIFMLSRK